jgi:hypothetical protein
LVRGANGTTEIIELCVGGTVLGLFPEIEFQEADIDLRTGDLLVAFTDGLTEALNSAGEEFGEVRLKEVLREGSSRVAISLDACRFDPRSLSLFLSHRPLCVTIRPRAVRAANRPRKGFNPPSTVRP